MLCNYTWKRRITQWINIFFFIDSVVFYILYLFDNVVSCSWYRRHRVVFICFFVLLQHVVITQWLAVWMSYYYMCVHAKYRNQKVLNKPTIWKQTFLAREGPAAMRRRLQLIPRQDRAQCHRPMIITPSCYNESSKVRKC